MAWLSCCRLPLMTFRRWMLLLALLALAWLLGSLLSALGIYMFINTEEYIHPHRHQPSQDSTKHYVYNYKTGTAHTYGVYSTTEQFYYKPWKAKFCLYVGMTINLISMLIMVMMIAYEKRTVIQRMKPDHPPSYKEVMAKAETPPPCYRELQFNDNENIFNFSEDEDSGRINTSSSTQSTNNLTQDTTIVNELQSLDSNVISKYDLYQGMLPRPGNNLPVPEYSSIHISDNLTFEI